MNSDINQLRLKAAGANQDDKSLTLDLAQFRSRANGAKTSKQTEVILVMSARQPFGMLMSQVYNIVRTYGENLKVISWPEPEKGRIWGEIQYMEGKLRVLELNRILNLPVGEPLQRSKILLSGKLLPDGSIEQPFGIAIDDILSVRQVPLEDLRLLPDWLTYKRLGRLLWGAAMIDRDALIQQGTLNELNSEDLVTNLQIADFMAEAASFTNQNSQAAPNPTKRPEVNPVLSFIGVNTNTPNRFGHPTEKQRPVMLLDLDVLKGLAYKPAAYEK